MVSLPRILSHSKNGTDAENEGQEHYHIAQTWNGCNQGLDQSFHGGQGLDLLQGLEHSECTQGFEALRVGLGMQTDNANHHNAKVQHVPCVPQVGVLVQEEAHGTYFSYALYDENPSEKYIDLGLHVVELRDVVGIISSSKVVRCHQNGVHNDHSRDEPFEPFPLAEPDQGISDAGLVMQKE